MSSVSDTSRDRGERAARWQALPAEARERIARAFVQVLASGWRKHARQQRRSDAQAEREVES